MFIGGMSYSVCMAVSMMKVFLLVHNVSCVLVVFMMRVTSWRSLVHNFPKLLHVLWGVLDIKDNHFFLVNMFLYDRFWL
jgi:hypothetical protein